MHMAPINGYLCTVQVSPIRGSPVPYFCWHETDA